MNRSEKPKFFREEDGPPTPPLEAYNSEVRLLSDYRPIDFDESPSSNSGQVISGDQLLLWTPEECASLPARHYVVKGLIGSGQIGCIFGNPGTGKSVFAPWLGYAVSRGEEVFGLRTRSGGVLYLASEDEAGMAARIHALYKDHGGSDGFRLVTGFSDLLSPGQINGMGNLDLEKVKRIENFDQVRLIVIDTLAMAMPGVEENDARSMARVVSIGRDLAEKGAAVIFVHHGTKAGGNTPRGHSVFNGALDFSIMVKSVDPYGIVRCLIQKNRNGPPDLKFAFRIGKRTVGQDVDGDAITAPICLPYDRASSAPEARLTQSERKAFNHIKEMAGNGGIAKAVWLTAAVAQNAISASENRESQRRMSARALNRLVTKGWIVEEEGEIRISPDFR